MQIALSAVIFGSLGVTVQGVLNVAPTNTLSITLLRALIALPVLVAASALLLGRGLLRIAAADLGVMIAAGLTMALYQIGFVIAMGYEGVAVTTLITLCTVPVYAAFLGRARSQSGSIRAWWSRSSARSRASRCQWASGLRRTRERGPGSASVSRC